MRGGKGRGDGVGDDMRDCKYPGRTAQGHGRKRGACFVVR